MAVAVVVPVKSFAEAKRRLADVLDPAARADLARRMAATVLAAAAPLPVIVVCDDDQAARWAEAAGATVVWTPGVGLNGAVEAGVAHLAAAGVDTAFVAHADLPLALDLGWLVEAGAAGGVTLVPDRHGDGTNVACVPTGAGFRFAYGAGSCDRHRAEAERLGLPVRVQPDERLGWDVDRPEDLEPPAHLQPSGAPCP